jgi:HAD superfamily hydrolase (TIGR01509 family)
MTKSIANNSARAVLWDVDGTLVDSAEYHWLTWREALAREHYALTRAQFESTFGQRNDTILRGYFGADFPTTEIERIAETKETLYRELIRTRGIEPLPGVRDWLARLQADGWRQCIASSAPRLNVEAIMSALGIEEYFQAFASAEEVARGKPHPDIFLAAARKVNVNPSRAVVVEDAPAGLEGARRAGCHTVGVLSTHATLEADIVVKTLAELHLDTFDRLVPVTI